MNDFFVPVATSTHQQTPIATSTGIAEEDEEFVTWEDTFFDNEENLIAVFDFDYPLMKAYKLKLLWVDHALGSLGVVLLVAVLHLYVDVAIDTFVILLVILDSFFLKKRAQWDAYSHHLCITRDGVKYVRDKRKKYYGWSCTDARKTTQIIPLDKVTHVDIKEPAGYRCCCIRNTLTVVKLSSSSSGLEGSSLVLFGLKEPYKFKNILMKVKRADSNSSMASAASAQIIPNRDVLPISSNKETI